MRVMGGEAFGGVSAAFVPVPAPAPAAATDAPAPADPALIPAPAFPVPATPEPAPAPAAAVPVDGDGDGDGEGDGTRCAVFSVKRRVKPAPAGCGDRVRCHAPAASVVATARATTRVEGSLRTSTRATSEHGLY